MCWGGVGDGLGEGVVVIGGYREKGVRGSVDGGGGVVDRFTIEAVW